jgi:ABC-type multidrug transport system ATPase subunit
MSGAPALACTALGKRYGSRWALRDCTLEIPAGTVTALVGPNGAGKTTLLQLAVGLTRPSAGEVQVLGRSPRRDAAIVLRGSASSHRSTRSTRGSPWRRCSGSAAS